MPVAKNSTKAKVATEQLISVPETSSSLGPETMEEEVNKVLIKGEDRGTMEEVETGHQTYISPTHSLMP